MREFSDEMRARLKTGATNFCRCWMIRRRDGISLGFTDHDRNLSFDDISFLANSGLNASVIETSTGLSVDNAQAIGALSADAINEADLLAGKYDGAEVFHWQVDWVDVSVRSLLFRGVLGEIRRGSGAFEAELRGIGEALNHPLGRSYLRECDRVFGDSKCGVDKDDPQYSISTEIVKIDANRRLTLFGLEAFPDAWFANGSVGWADGSISLIKSDSYSDGARVLELWEEVRHSPNIGETAKIVAGCDKCAGTCRAKFQNFDNFRGFPHLLGEDFSTAYPVTGESHNGQSRYASDGAGDA